MKNLRYAIRLTIAFISRFKYLILFSALVGILSFYFFTKYNRIFWGKEVERIGVTGRYHLDQLPDSILKEISSGLTQLDDSGKPLPAIASSWETPDEGKSWVFKIKDNLFWQDGEKITSESIQYEFSDVKIDRPDEKTIIFRLENSFSPFPSVVSKPTFKQGLLGNGEWTVKDATLVEGYVSELILTDTKSDKRIYKFYPSESRTKLAFKRGEVDKILELYDISPFDTWQTVDITTNENSEKIVSLFFNTEDKLFSNKSARQAMIYAIDKNSFEGQRALSPIYPDSWAYNSQVKKYTFNTTRAKELLEDIPEEVKKSQVKLVSTPLLLSTAEKIAKFWNDIGIDTAVQVTSIIPEEFQVYLTILDSPEDPDQYPIWHGSQTSSNISNFSNPRIDKLLEDGRTELNPEERKKIYLDFQRFLVEESPAAFLYHPVTYTVNRK